MEPSTDHDTPASDRLASVQRAIHSVIQHLAGGIDKLELVSEAGDDEDLRPDMGKLMAVLLNLYDRLAIIQSEIVEARLLVKEELEEACAQVPISIHIDKDPRCKMNEAMQRHLIGDVTTEYESSGLDHALNHTCIITEPNSGMTFTSSSPVKGVAQKQSVILLLAHFSLLD